MNDLSADTMIGLGLFAAAFALISDNFYPSMIRGGTKPLPKWFGRLWFLTFALFMFYFGIRHFLEKR